MSTVITHFYNEEYLLPWWLEHHKKYFSNGILIDYGSTDRSVEIIKEHAPHWQVFPSAWGNFDAEACDREVEWYERQISGWRIALTVTEFLVGKVKDLLQPQPGEAQWRIPALIFAEWEPDGSLDVTKPLWKQYTNAVAPSVNPAACLCRSLHNYNSISYLPGRHWVGANTGSAMVFKFSNLLVGEPMIRRRLQIGGRISERDKQSGCSDQHIWAASGGLNEGNLEAYLREKVYPLGVGDCRAIIEELCNE